MSKLTPPSPKHLAKRRDFFLAHLDLPNAKWEVFHISNLLIKRDYDRKLITYPQFINKLRELDATQGLPVNNESEFKKE